MTPATPLQRVWLVANLASGSTADTVVAGLETELAQRSIEIAGRTDFPAETLPGPDELSAAGADTLVVLGGDGTINAAVLAAADWDGQCLILPGGTMNMLAKKLHGDTDIAAIVAGLDKARRVALPLVESGDTRGLVGAIVGPAAAWVHAREGLRQRRFWRAMRAAQVAWARSFGGGVRIIGAGGRHRAVVVTPDDRGLEVVAIDADGVGDALRLGWSWLTGDWRNAQQVATGRALSVDFAGGRRVRALFDGEPVMLASPVTLRHGWTSLHFVATA